MPHVRLKRIRARTSHLLDADDHEDRLSILIDASLILMITLNVLVVILETLPELEESYRPWFRGFEIFSIALFSIEYIARVWSAVEVADDGLELGVLQAFRFRLRYMFTPMAMIDLVAILPFYFAMFFSIDLRFMRALRLLRVFKLTRYSSSMSLLLEVLLAESRSIAAALFLLFVLTIMASSLMYLAEHKAQPEAFSSIPAAMWWAIITMTGVGYGDVTPITDIGKLIAAVIAVISIGIIALPAGLLASGFSEAVRRRRLRYEQSVERALGKGVVDDGERVELERLTKKLGLSAEEADLIMESRKSKLSRR